MLWAERGGKELFKLVVEASKVVQWIKNPRVTPVSRVRALVPDQAAPLPIQLHTDAPGKGSER